MVTNQISVTHVLKVLKSSTICTEEPLTSLAKSVNNHSIFSFFAIVPIHFLCGKFGHLSVYSLTWYVMMLTCQAWRQQYISAESC